MNDIDAENAGRFAVNRLPPRTLSISTAATWKYELETKAINTHTTSEI